MSFEGQQTYKQYCENDPTILMEMESLPQLIIIKPVFSYVPPVPLDKG